MSKHTPGPWYIESITGPHENAEIACVPHPLYDAVEVYASGQYGELGEHHANANLIAAAPDLLAACIEVLPWVAIAMAHRRDKRPEFDAHPDAVKNHEKALAMLQAAIAKAEGNP